MSLMLASVNSLEEARLIQRFNVDIIDLKQPAEGALGALPVEVVREVVTCLKPIARISATVGDLPMQPGLLAAAVSAMAATEVDFVKIGFFPGGDWQASITALSALAGQGHALIAVLFADTGVDFAIIPALALAGFRGVMLDTMDKSQGRLTQLLSLGELQGFVQVARDNSLLTGLAGSLAFSDIADLLPLHADYLGFRGALCHHACRTAQLDEQQIMRIRQKLS